jgi:sigma-B regulation protein RsbU (phosphoserine phosphatase)
MAAGVRREARRVSLGQRLGLLGLGYVALFLLCAATSLWTAALWDRLVDERTVLLRSTATVERLRAAYSDQESGERGFALTGDEPFLAPYTMGREAEARALRDLARVAEAFPAVADSRRAVVEAADAWRQEAAEPGMQTVRESGTIAASAVVATGVGNQRFEALRAALDGLSAEIERHVAVAEQDSSAAGRLLVGVVATALVLMVASTLLAGGLLRCWVSRPLGRLARAVSRLRHEQGEPMVAVPIEGPAEVRAVGHAIDDLQRAVRGQRDEAIQAKEALEQSATLAVQVHASLAGRLGEFPAGWSVAAQLRPAEGLAAGDCYDVSLVGPDKIGIVMLDIAGHGAKPAVTALRCKELLKAGLRSAMGPGEALDWLYTQDHGFEPGEFLTAVVVLVDTRTGVCEYANAGHPPPVAVGRRRRTWWRTGPLFGPVPGPWETRCDRLRPGEKLVMYTDGLPEARDQDRQFYGEKRLADLLARAPSEDAGTVLELILDDLVSFNAGRLQDDVTVIVACRAQAGQTSAVDLDRRPPT